MSDKLGAKSNKCLFVGYSKKTIRYYFYNALEQKVFVSKHVIFLEKEFLLKESSGSKIELGKVKESQSKSTDLSREVTGESMQTQTPRCSIRVRTVPKWISYGSG